MVELLSPAGNYDGFIAALSAGADAVYAGGRAFGARANAQNFTDAELLLAIDTAHMYGRKFYLTVNTLCKEREFEELLNYLLPLYEQGLDGVIVQDLGVISFIRKHFPLMEVHASTQMTLTGSYGAKYLDSLGATRIVPARELSLKEIDQLHKETSLEIECFIHGAMCYSYSGACYMSSFLGGRSGNRGRCAQPCRLPYSYYEDGKKLASDKELYLLSMKDLCTIELLPQLIEAGITSFKIEGRMKKSSYTHTVTSIYRKYIDLYLEKGREGYEVSKDDYKLLTENYLRSQAQDGYYRRHNGRELITLYKPSYESSTLEACESFEMPGIKIKAKALFNKEKQCSLQLSYNDNSVLVYGQEVEKAQKSPVDKERITQQLSKLGGTNFIYDSLEVDADDDIFIPMGAINELRRSAIDSLKVEINKKYRRQYIEASGNELEKNTIKNNRYENTNDRSYPVSDSGKTSEKPSITVLCDNLLQFQECIKRIDELKRIYIDTSIILNNREQFAKIINEYDFSDKLFLALPYIFRAKDKPLLKEILESDCLKSFSGFLIRNYEELQLIKSDFIKFANNKIIVSDAGLYTFNKASITQLQRDGVDLFTAPLELNIHELKERGYNEYTELHYYGNIPMMLSAGCTHKTATGKCNKISFRRDGELQDRYDKRLKTINDCNYCYNRILNSVPICLDSEKSAVIDYSPESIRLAFTTEDARLCGNIIDRIIKGVPLDIKDYTKGHFRKSVD